MWISITPVYSVSDEGHVRNNKTSRILTPWKSGRYNAVWLGAGNRYYVHKLVADRFLPAPTGDCEVDHKDRNPLNNSADNLRWVSKSINALNKNISTKKRKQSQSEEHHIHYDGYRYRVVFNLQRLKHTSSHPSLEEAVSIRDSLINQFNFTE